MCDNSLVMESCQEIPEGSPALDDHEIGHLLSHVDEWELIDGALEKTLVFEDFFQTMAFVNAVAWVSHREGHHPELVVGEDFCTIRYSTLTVGGLSRNDFLCAAKIDHLIE